MKRLLLILILTLIFQTLTKADDISDFEIEGMSIGDSALKYFTKEEIISSVPTQPYNDDGYYGVEFQSNQNTYEVITLIFKKSDDKFIIHSLSGYNLLDFEKCKKEKKSIVEEIKSILENAEEKNYKSKFGEGYGKSFALVTDLIVNGGSIRIWCDNFDKNHDTAKKWPNAINVDFSTKEFLFWIDNIAYN